MSRGPRPLGTRGRDALLAGMRGAAARPQSDPTPEVAPAPAQAHWDTAFAGHDAYRAIAAQRDFSAALGLANPYYHLHDARAGRTTQIDGRPLLNFASYDYLGLNADPRVADAMADAARTWGGSVSASRLTGGERPLHRALEAALAEHYNAADALLFVSGHATNVATISALVGPGDLVIHDAFAHNSIVVGAQASGARRLTYPHNDLAALDGLLARHRPAHRHALVVTEGLFSMDGDCPDLAGLVALKQRWGAWLMVDEAHALGVLGASGRGSAEAQGVDPAEVDIWMGTLSKTLAGCGGYIAGSAALIDILRYTASGMVYSVGLSPVIAAGSAAALNILIAEPERVTTLGARSRRFHEGAASAGLDTGLAEVHAIVPVLVGDSIRALLVAARLQARGINVVPILPPAVPENSSRLRFFVSALHTEADIDTAIAATAEEIRRAEAEGVSLAAALGGARWSTT